MYETKSLDHVSTHHSLNMQKFFSTALFTSSKFFHTSCPKFALKNLDVPLITPELVRMSKNDIREILATDLRLIVGDVSHELGFSLPEPLDLIIEARDVKFMVISRVEKRWGVLIPSNELRVMNSPRIVLNWYLERILTQMKPIPSFHVPENVKHFLRGEK